MNICNTHITELHILPGSLLVRPFLPDVEDSSDVCDQDEALGHNNVTKTVVDVDDNHTNIPDLAWPFLIISLIHLLCGLGYICLSTKYTTENPS